jgi:hypothetical protein
MAAHPVSREVARHGGRPKYRAGKADHQAWKLALRPRPCLLALHKETADEYPSNETMRVSHVEPARCKLLAISRIDKPEAMPREISSRSASVWVLAERRRTAGAIPPCCDNKK